MKEDKSNYRLFYVLIPLFMILFVGGFIFGATATISPSFSKIKTTPTISSSNSHKIPVIKPVVENHLGVLLPPGVTNAYKYFKNVTPKNKDSSYSSVENTWATCSSQGSKKIPIFLVEFSDKLHQPDLSVQDFDDMYNSDYYLDGNAQSVSTYYNIASNEALDLSYDVYDWREVSQPYSYYIQDSTTSFYLILDTVDAFSDIDFSQYDNDNDGRIDGMVIIHAGLSAQDEPGNLNDSSRILSGTTQYSVQGLYLGNTNIIASHYSEFNCGAYRSAAGYYPEDCRTKVQVGVHEFAHILGLPDLYGITPSGQQNGGGLGNLSVMTDTRADRSRPIAFDPWSKYFFGWANVNNVIDDYGIYNLTSQADTHEVYKLQDTTKQFSNEFFLVANRFVSETNQDRDLLKGLHINALNPNGGLEIYHIDEDYIQSHYDGEVCFNCIMYDEDGNYYNDEVSHPGIIFEQNILETTGAIPPVTFSDFYTTKHDELAGIPWGVFDSMERLHVPNIIDLPWDTTSNTYNGLGDTEVEVHALAGDGYTLKAYLQSKAPEGPLTSEILNPENNQTFYTDESISFEATYTNNIGTATCEWYKDYDTNPTLINTQCNFLMEASFISNGLDNPQLITLKVTDELEQESLSEVTINIIQAPIFLITILNPAPDESFHYLDLIDFNSSYINNTGEVSCLWKDETNQILSQECNFSLVPEDFGWNNPPFKLFSTNLIIKNLSSSNNKHSNILFSPTYTYITYPHTITLTAQDESDNISSASVDIKISPIAFEIFNFIMYSPE